MKPGDLVRIVSPPRPTRDYNFADKYHDKVGLIVEWCGAHAWIVFISDESVYFQEKYLEPVDETR